MTLQKGVFNRKTYLKCYFSSLLCTLSGHSFIDLPTSAFCTSSNYKELCKRFVHFKELESWATLRVKADGHAFEWISATWLANQGGSTSTCKSRGEYIGLQITTYLHFKQRHFWEKWIWKLHQHAVRKCSANTCCANICCAIYALQIHGVWIYAVQIQPVQIYALQINGVQIYAVQKKCKNSAYGVFFGATDRSNTRKVEPKFII